MDDTAHEHKCQTCGETISDCYGAWFNGNTCAWWDGLCGPCTNEEYGDECQIIVEIEGRAQGEQVGICSADGRPIYRSHFAGTIYHASEDGWTTAEVQQRTS